MRVVVTGSSGFLGRHVARRLAEAGCAVRGIDAAPLPPDHAGWEHASADLTDLAAALQLVRDADALVHVAAIPRPTGRPAGEVFHVNVASCFNAVEAARLARIPRIVYASSFSVMGYPFGAPFAAPAALPLDETDPASPQDAYGLSKWLGEEIVEAAVRQGGISAVSLRMPWVQSPETFFSQVGPRRETAEAVRDLWSYLDLRDAAEAFLLALRWQGEGHLRAYVAADDTYLDEDTGPALARALPDVPLRRPLAGSSGLIDTRLAREALGFAARHSWRDYAKERA